MAGDRGETRRPVYADAAFAMMTAVLIVVSHAVAYLTHEFSHSITAWALGYMADPLALDYGAPTPGNLVLLSDVGDNVPYDPILRGGHGLVAAAIALAGPFVGNGLLYVLLYAARGRLLTFGPAVRAFAFWLMLMCAANVWSYVPIRAITSHADIAIAADGLHVGVLALFPVLLVPSLILVVHFFARTCPLFIRAIAPGGTARTASIVALTAAWFFMLFGGIGLSGSYGPVAQAFSIVSVVLLFPLVLPWLWERCRGATEGPSERS